MLISSGGCAASSSGCGTRPRARETGSTVYAGPTQHSLLIGRYVMATAEHREPCDSRGACTVLGAPGGEIPSGDSTAAAVLHLRESVSFTAASRLCAGSIGGPFGARFGRPARVRQHSRTVIGCQGLLANGLI